MVWNEFQVLVTGMLTGQYSTRWLKSCVFVYLSLFVQIPNDRDQYKHLVMVRSSGLQLFKFPLWALLSLILLRLPIVWLEILLDLKWKRWSMLGTFYCPEVYILYLGVRFQIWFQKTKYKHLKTKYKYLNIIYKHYKFCAIMTTQRVESKGLTKLWIVYSIFDCLLGR
jgi:hypothetical protein